jgi:hypothetical protein
MLPGGLPHGSPQHARAANRLAVRSHDASPHDPRALRAELHLRRLPRSRLDPQRVERQVRVRAQLDRRPPSAEDEEDLGNRMDPVERELAVRPGGHPDASPPDQRVDDGLARRGVDDSSAEDRQRSEPDDELLALGNRAPAMRGEPVRLDRAGELAVGAEDPPGVRDVAEAQGAPPAEVVGAPMVERERGGAGYRLPGLGLHPSLDRREPLVDHEDDLALPGHAPGRALDLEDLREAGEDPDRAGGEGAQKEATLRIRSDGGEVDRRLPVAEDGADGAAERSSVGVDGPTPEHVRPDRNLDDEVVRVALPLRMDLDRRGGAVLGGGAQHVMSDRDLDPESAVLPGLPDVPEVVGRAQVGQPGELRGASRQRQPGPAGLPAAPDDPDDRSRPGDGGRRLLVQLVELVDALVGHDEAILLAVLLRGLEGRFVGKKDVDEHPDGDQQQDGDPRAHHGDSPVGPLRG